MNQGAFRNFLKENIPENSNIIGGIFFLAIRSCETDAEVLKSCFVIQGHIDPEKNFLVHCSTNKEQQILRFLIEFAAIFGLRIWTQDISQAYLQSSSRLTRKVFVRPKSGITLKTNELPQLRQPLYRLTNSHDCWHEAMTNHLNIYL